MPESGERAKGSAGLAPSVLTNAVKCLTLSASCIGSIPIEIKWAGLDRGTAGRLRLVRHRPSASDNRLSATLMTGSLQPGCYVLDRGRDWRQRCPRYLYPARRSVPAE